MPPMHPYKKDKMGGGSGRWNHGPPLKDVHFQVPEAVMYYFTWQRHFEDVIKLRVLRWEVYPGLSGRAQCDHRVLGGQREEKML